jgi:hypothetical protein
MKITSTFRHGVSVGMVVAIGAGGNGALAKVIATPDAFTMVTRPLNTWERLWWWLCGLCPRARRRMRGKRP